MKTKLFFVLLLSVSLMHSQVPSFMAGIPYQGIARNSSGNELVNTSIGLEITIHQTTNSNAVYKERWTVTTNQFGLFNINIGTSTMVVQGNFANIPWSQGPFFLEIGLDPAGGSNYTSLGTTQFLSVPYALYSAISGNGPPGATGPTGPSGPQGATGPGGLSGATGPAGPSGSPGPTGPTGSPGGIGPQGPSGPTGANGSTGATGPQGPTGSNGATGATGPTGTFGVTGTTGQTIHHNGTTWVNSSALFNDGSKIGVGTTSTPSQLNIGNSPGTEIEFVGVGTSEIITPNSMVISASQNLFVEANALYFRTGFLDRVFINNSGNVGIGTINPNFRLDVNGTGRFSGALSIGSYTLPTIDGASNQVLTTNGSGTVSWSTITGLPGGSSRQTLFHNGSNWVSNSFLNAGLSSVGVGVSSPVSSFAVGTGANEKFSVAGSDGDLSFSDPQGSITFPAVSSIAPPMIQMFSTGTGNFDRMVIGHSPGFQNWGLQYQDGPDIFRFLAGGTPVFNVNLNSLDITYPHASAGTGKYLSSDAVGTAKWDYALGPIKGATYTSFFNILDNGMQTYNTAAPFMTFTPASSGIAKIEISMNYNFNTSLPSQVFIGFFVGTTPTPPGNSVPLTAGNRVGFASNVGSAFGDLSVPVIHYMNVTANTTYYIWLGASDSANFSQTGASIGTSVGVVTLHQSGGM
jgi:hypothetical protein